jgi:acyl-CoA hydrolase
MSASLRLSSPTAALDPLRPGTTVFVPGMSGESLAFFEALTRHPDRAEGLTIVGVHFPGINRCDYLGLHPSVRQRGYFMSPALREGLSSGRVDLMPLDYPGIVRDLERMGPMDVAIAQVSSPDERGMCSLGVSQDFLPSVWNTAKFRIAHINPRLARTRGSFAVRASDCDVAFESDSAISTLQDETPDAASLNLAALVAGLIEDGDTLQFGVGRLQTAVLGSLKNHRRLRVYSGMVSAPVIGLMDAGAIDGTGAIECGVALGNEAFYTRLDRDPTFFFRPAAQTHDIRRLAAIPNFCAINSALQVDLFGQVKVDSLNGRLVAGVGGLPVFAAGAQLSPGGRSIIVLGASADKGRVSRIVCATPGPNLVALPRHAGDIVVTEYGVAQLRGRNVQQRAHALISIAAPEFRDELAAEWRDAERRL